MYYTILDTHATVITRVFSNKLVHIIISEITMNELSMIDNIPNLNELDMLVLENKIDS